MQETILEKYLSYLKEERQMKPRSLKDYETAVKILSQEIDPLKAEKFHEVNEAIKRLKTQRMWSGRTVAKYAICIKNFYAWLTREEIIKHNPFPFHEFKRQRPKEPKFLIQSQFDKLISDPFLNTQERAILSLLWDTGIRRAELCGLNRSDVDLKESILHVRQEISKGEYSFRYIPFTEKTRDILEWQVVCVERLAREPSLFINKVWKRIDERDVSEMISRIGMKETPYKSPMKLTCHQFRHGFGIRQLERGVPETVVSKWLGHTGLSMTQHYIHLTKESSKSLYFNVLAGS